MIRKWFITSFILLFLYSAFLSGAIIRDRTELTFTVLEEKNGLDSEDFSEGSMIHTAEKSSIDESIFPSRTVKVNSVRSLRLNGHIDEKSLESHLKSLQQHKEGTLVIEVNATSGDLNAVLDLAKKIYAAKAQQGIQVVVYIDENAIGPAAIIPFLADKLYISYFVSWGDIPLGTEEALPTNLLRNRVISLIPPERENSTLLRLLASGMADPGLRIVDENGWKEGEGPGAVSEKGETLVVNHNQLESLGLIEGIMPPAAFRNRFEEPSVEGDLPVVIAVEEGIDQRLKDHIKFDEKGPNLVGLIKIEKDSQISNATWIYVKNAIDYYKKKNVKLVILELNTPGGEVFSAQKISDALKELDTQFNIPVVTFINNWAISAGAMLAYSTRFITVVKDGTMGAAEPVIAGESGQMKSASEKVNSAIRADFANRASFFDRNPYVAEAMVDKDVILVERFGKIIKLNSEDQIRKTGPNRDKVISPKGKLLTLNAGEMIEYGVADIMLQPQKLEIITAAEKEKGEWPASKYLVFHYPFFEQIPFAVIDSYKMDWRTQFLVLLANPMVGSLLFLGMIIGFYVELNSPGFGIPGSVGLACLSMIVISSFALEVANFLELVLLLVGVVFIVLDILLIPTFGLLGVVGVIFFLIGLFGMMLPGIEGVDFEFDTQTFNAAGEVFMMRLAWLSGALVVGVIAIALLGRYVLPSFKGFKRFVLESAEEGYRAGAEPSELPQPGTKGQVYATLRPSGKVQFDEEIFEAITMGEFINKGEKVKIVKLDGNVIIVDKDESS